MIPFLQSVAIELTARYGAELSDFVFVVPHKRGVVYLRRYFERALSDRLLRQPSYKEMPEIITIAEHVGTLSQLKPASRLQLLFLLYDTFRSLYAKTPSPLAEEFEEFRRWGETAVSDFNDVDMYGADADALFRNLSDYNKIGTDFLSDGQKQVIEKYFGVSDPGSHINGFWKHVHKEGQVQNRFMSLWEKLAPLYREFGKRLEEKGLSYPGLAFRRACERVENGEYSFQCKRVVYVGFNALSTVERRLFKAVRSRINYEGESLADFFWDAPGPALAENSPVEGAKFLYMNAREFPCSLPEMSKYSDFKNFPEVMQEIACPGNTAQAKVAAGLLDKIIRGKGEPYINPARVAIVLPDEGLLFPVFYSIPAEVAHNVNLTMGYPLRQTSIASFVDLLRILHSRARKKGGILKYFGKDVSSIMSHPLTRAFVGQETANLINGYMIESKLYFVSAGELERAFKDDFSEKRERIALLFAPLPEDDNPQRLMAQVCELLRRIKDSLSGESPSGRVDEADLAEELPHGADLGTVHIDRYIEAFTDFADQCATYGMRLKSRTAFAMACRILASATVPMQGEPLTGLQIMGMLETRALDFDYLIIPSMNERIFPRKLRAHTFIPEALRIGYGIATTRFQEEIFAYHFYRLIARAKEVYLLYDASQGGLKSGDPSRYLLQLRYLFGNRCSMQRLTARFNLSTKKNERLLSVVKEGETLKLLLEYLDPDSGKRLSASSLKDYISCPLKFYFAYILKKKVDEAPSEFMSAIEIGNVLHETMQYLYDSLKPGVDKPAIVTREIIENWLNGGQAGEYRNVHELASARVRRNYMPSAPDTAPLPGDALITLEMLELQVKWCLMADLKLAPFEYLASEWQLGTVYKFDKDRNVNMTMIIDRLDRVRMKDGNRCLRIVDYKTGQDNTSFSTVSELFSLKGEHKAIFQLMLYAMLLCDEVPEFSQESVSLSIYKSRQLHTTDYDTSVRQDNNPVISHLPLLPEFKERLDETLRELFNVNVPFEPRDGMPDGSEFTNKPCRYCQFRRLCLG